VGSPTNNNDIQNDDFDQILLDINNIFTTDLDTDLLKLQPIIAALAVQSTYDDFGKQIRFITDSFEQQSSTTLFIFAVAAFYIIVRSENPKLKIQTYNRILSLVFISLLASSLIVTPLSISESYYAHAETEKNVNFTDDMPPESLSDQIFEQENILESDIETIIPSSALANITEYPLGETLSESSSTLELESYENTIISTNTTSITTTNSTNQTTSATFIPTPTNATTPTTPATPLQTVLSLIENLNIIGNSATPTNATTPTILPHIVIPNATKSWNVNATTDSKFVGDVHVNQTGIILDGGFIKSAGNYTNQTSNLAVAAWIKPEYTSGASVFTILSKDKSFELALNNIVHPQRIATFSVFDGIKWHSVQTSTEIGQSWSHIAATFNGTEISIYVNGTISKTVKTIPTITLDSSGNRQNTTPEMAAKDSEIVVGATLDTRTVDTAQKAFTGSLDEVEIYDKYLTAQQILALYQRTLPLISAKPVPLPPIQIELPPINLLNQTNINGTLATNATEHVIVPTVNQTNKLTISAWVDPNYNNLSDELTEYQKPAHLHCL